MKVYKLVLCSLFVLLFYACDKDEVLTPSDSKENYYAVDSSATDSVSILRHEFYQRDSSYLLFNDTLRHEVLGKDNSGNVSYFTETVDIGYSMTSSTMPEKYVYNYIISFKDKKAAVAFVDSCIIPHLSTKLRPFSFLLVNNITGYVSEDDGISYTNEGAQTYVVGDRCAAIATSALNKGSSSDFAKSILAGILMKKINAQSSSTLEVFTDYSSSLYGNSSGSSPSSKAANLVFMEQSGFIVAYSFTLMGYSVEVWGTYPTQSADLSSFVNLVTTKTEDEVKSQYGGYPIVMEKYYSMKNILLNLGYIF